MTCHVTNPEIDIDSGKELARHTNGSSTSNTTNIQQSSRNGKQRQYGFSQNGSSPQIGPRELQTAIPRPSSEEENSPGTQLDFASPPLHLPLVPPDPNFSLGQFNDDELANTAIAEDADSLQVFR